MSLKTYIQKKYIKAAVVDKKCELNVTKKKRKSIRNSSIHSLCRLMKIPINEFLFGGVFHDFDLNF